MCTQHNVVVNLQPDYSRPLDDPGFPGRFIERRDLAARQVTSRAKEDPGIADSDGDVVARKRRGMIDDAASVIPTSRE